MPAGTIFHDYLSDTKGLMMSFLAQLSTPLPALPTLMEIDEPDGDQETPGANHDAAYDAAAVVTDVMEIDEPDIQEARGDEASSICFSSQYSQMREILTKTHPSFVANSIEVVITVIVEKLIRNFRHDDSTA